MTIQLFDLAGQDENLRFSPFCWRAKMALRHKGLEATELPWRFTEKERIAATGQGRVPVLVDGDRWISDSWQIARHLDDAFPAKPALMTTPAERSAARFVNFWSDTTLHPALRPLIMLDVFGAAAEQDQAYFRQSREELFGKPLEQLCDDREAAIGNLHKVLAPLEMTLAEFAFLGGSGSNYSDYVFFGSLQWAHVVSPERLLPAGSAIEKWFERMLDLFDGYARKSPTIADRTAA
jgi:glutathione S-transferase